MTLTLAEFLDLGSVRDARPLLVVPPVDSRRRVRWVHSSEIYEIGPLLSEGDLLLTTGLGLAGADAGARRHWVRELAARGVAAVAVELGRSLPTLPLEVSAEARVQNLPLLVLQDVVPFIRICEEANSAVLDAEGRRLRVVDRLVEDVHAALAGGGGAADLVACAARSLGAPVALVTRAEQVVAAAGVGGQRQTDRLLRRPLARAPVRIWDAEWGAVVVGESAVDPRTAELAAARLAGSAAVLLGREGSGGPSDVVAPFLADLLAGAVPGHRELLVRAGLAGFHPSARSRVVGVAASSPDPAALVAGWRTTATAAGLDVLAHVVRGEVLALVSLPGHGPAPEAARDVGDRLAAEDAVVTIGPAVPFADVARSLQEAHASLGTATLLGESVALSRDLTMPRLLGRLDDATLDRLAADNLGSLLAWDRAHGTALVATLDAYLRRGCSPTRTAAELHLQRQSLYQRLARIEELLGHRPDDARAHEVLVVATCAARVLAARRRSR